MVSRWAEYKNDSQKTLSIISLLFCIPNICSNSTLLICVHRIDRSLLYLSNFVYFFFCLLWHMRCHESHTKTHWTNAYTVYFGMSIHICVFLSPSLGFFLSAHSIVSNYRKMSIDTLKVARAAHSQFQIPLPFHSNRMTHEISQKNEQYPPHMICMKNTDKCQKRYRIFANGLGLIFFYIQLVFLLLL